MKKILTLLIVLSLVLSSCSTVPHDETTNVSQATTLSNVAEYQLANIQTKFGESSGLIVELQGKFPVFEYNGEDIQYARYCEDLNDILSREAESWTELANEILESAHTLCMGNKELMTFSFGIDILCEVSDENGYPAVTFFVCEVRGPGSGGECNYQIKYHTDDGTMIYRTLTETTRVY